MNKSYRIKTDVGTNADKYIKLKLEQEVDTFEILSLSINQKDIYQNFNCDYGVLIGRVNANGSVGIPNVKVSIFIPISEEDESNPEIKAQYPYKTPREKNLDGKRYNLLPRVAQKQTDGTIRPKQPFGSFPTKEEFLTNETLLEVYDKYYKYSTVTNEAGDYMLFGVPIGIQTVHISVDITDIGKYSMNPASMVTNLGYSPNLFNENASKIKPSEDLDDLVNIETQEVSVDIIPFCGDSDTFDIGITRQDFRMRAQLISTFTVFGSAFTDAFHATWGQNDHKSGDKDPEMWRINEPGNDNVGISSKRNGKILIDVYYYPNTILDAELPNEVSFIDNGNTIDPQTDIVKLDESEYTSYIEDGEFVLIINTNRRKVITNEIGEEEIVPNDSQVGIFTEFCGMFFCEYGPELPLPQYGDIVGGKFNDHTYSGQRWKMKIPQLASFNKPLNKTQTGVFETYNDFWRKSYKKFIGNKTYSVSKFQWLDYLDGDGDNRDYNNPTRDVFANTGIIVTSGDGDFSDTNPDFEFPDIAGTGRFGGEWINFCLHFPQHTYFITKKNSNRHSNSNPTYNTHDRHFYKSNTQKIVANVEDTRNYLRNDAHFTQFIEVPVEDIVKILDYTKSGESPKGWRSTQAPYNSDPLTGTYLPPNDIQYFYKGFDNADCILMLESLGLI